MAQKEKAKKLGWDLTGQKFGDLTVIRRIENSRSGASRWLCGCVCGADYEVLGTLLTNGKRTRCTSRAHGKNYAFADITGQRFGRLTALYPSRRYDKSGSVIWRCRCDCGTETDISYNSLMYTKLKSCGCQKKEHDQKLRTYLTHVDGTSVDMLKSKKIPADNTTGHKGVYLVRGRYMAKIVFQKKQYYLGTYDRIEDAVTARKAAEEVLFDSVAEHYRCWKRKAELDPEWAEANPIRIHVTQEGKELRADLLPRLTENGEE